MLLFVTFIFCYICLVFFFFKQKTAYEMRISDWSSDVCSSDLMRLHIDTLDDTFTGRIESPLGNHDVNGSVRDDVLSWQMKANKPIPKIGRASCRERVCQYV